MRFLMIAGTFLMTIVLYVDRSAIQVVKDSVTGELSLDERQWSWIMAAFGLGYALFQTPSGLLADRFGPRRLLSAVVVLWSIFTMLTATAWNFVSLVVVRFLFGAGESGAFPGCARAIYSWIPMSERGIVQGINFSGSRLGAAFALPLVAWLVGAVGWRTSFVVLGMSGFVWVIFWYLCFRDDPAKHPWMGETELRKIRAGVQDAKDGGDDAPPLTVGTLLGSRNMWLMMFQYFCSNFTFFFCLSWLHPHLKEKFELSGVDAGFYAAAPFVFGALGNWVAGALVDALYRRGWWILSRRLIAIVGFALAAVGMATSVYMETPFAAVAWLSVAIFGADMTLSPSWSLCIDIGRRNAGAVSGTMNMAGNLGSFVTALAYSYLKHWSGTVTLYFLVGTALNILAIVAWCFPRPDRPLEEY